MRRWPLVALLITSTACVDDDEPAPVANGTLGPWLEQTRLPVARANHASTVIGDDVVVLGGNRRMAPGGPFVATDLIHAAAIGADGSLASWREVGRLPSPVTELAAAAWGDTLLAIDGIYDDDTKGAQVWAATRAEDGTLGAFTSLGPLPAGLRAISSEAWVLGDTLYVTSGHLPNDGDTLVLLVAQLGAPPLVWTELTIAPSPGGWRGQPQYVFDGAAIHALGGYLGGSAQVVADSQWARLDHGTATPVGAGPSLLAPTEAGEAIAVDGFAFLVGGKPMVLGTPGVPAVSTSSFNDDGSLDEWNASTPLPVGRTNHDLALGPTHLYLTGGSLDSGGLDTVFAAQVRFVAVP